MPSGPPGINVTRPSSSALAGRSDRDVGKAVVVEVRGLDDRPEPVAGEVAARDAVARLGKSRRCLRQPVVAAEPDPYLAAER